MSNHSDAIKKMQELANYIMPLSLAIQEHDPVDDFNDDAWNGWLQSWEAYRAANVNCSDAMFDSAYADGDGFDRSLATWRESANVWWHTARDTGRIRTAKDAGTDIKEGNEPPGEDDPDVEIDSETPVPGKTPPKQSPPKKGPPKGKDVELEANRKKPWIALLLVAAPVAFLFATRKRG